MVQKYGQYIPRNWSDSFHTTWEGAIERPPPCEMVQVASVFNQFCDLLLALSCLMACCSFQTLCYAHHLILSFVTRMFCWCAATLTALFGAPYSPSPHLKGVGFSSPRPGSTGLTLGGGEAPRPTHGRPIPVTGPIRVQKSS